MNTHRFTNTRAFSLLIILLSIPSFLAGAPADKLTNDDVIKLSKAGISGGVIIEKIHSSETTFVTDVDSLLRLREAGVSDAVIEAMVKQGSAAKASTATAVSSPSPTPVVSQSERTSKRQLFYNESHRDGTKVVVGIFMNRRMMVNDVRSQSVHFEPERIWSELIYKDGKGIPFDYLWDDLQSGCLHTGGWGGPYFELSFPKEVIRLSFTGDPETSTGNVRAGPRGSDQNIYIYNTLKNNLEGVPFSDKCK